MDQWVSVLLFLEKSEFILSSHIRGSQLLETQAQRNLMVLDLYGLLHSQIHTRK